MDYDELVKGLEERGFQGTEGICNKGDCHKNDKHFILLTDGLVIYSNHWDWNSCGNREYSYPDGLYEIWALSNPENSWLVPGTKEFSFEELDFIMKD